MIIYNLIQSDQEKINRKNKNIVKKKGYLNYKIQMIDLVYRFIWYIKNKEKENV